ncbi:MAG: alpha/beta fold hydrolase, partial [Saprospiraceae bacterium]|nr:alpha/beta fold hydrolase [Saprospiraceae bacterium]
MKNTLLFNGRRIAYFLSEDGWDSPNAPLVLLHGFCEDASMWAPVLPYLSGLPVLRIDLPGFGASDLAIVPGIEGYAAAVCAVLNELNLPRCVLFGHSMGGYTALAIAAQHPE